ncbi:ArnT family glycosyltransferase [Nitrosopumilus sp.]|uniref:ArnT family glycosyltransferase n=1 Tax=Nitrosopumilus sp. TaxID=2024843 RepID=UPI003D0A8BF3
MNEILQKNNIQFFKKPVFGLIFIIIGSIIFKLIFFPLEIPVILDGLNYYFFAMDIKITEEIPNYSPSKIGWPFFLSIIFNVIPSNETFVFMEIQKIVSITIFSLISIPIFFLTKFFVPEKYGVIAAGIFVFDPRVGINSSLGSSDPLFVLLLATSLVLFLKTKEIFTYISFLTVGLATTVRPEGVFLFLAMTVLFFIRNRKKGIKNLKYLLCLVIFFGILFPFLNYQESIHGNDLLFDRIEHTATYHSQDPQITKGDSGIPFILKGIENFPKYLGWVLIPNFIIFVPIGFILFLKKIDFNKISLILSGLFLSIPIFYAYAIPLQDTRYLLPLYPLFSIWAIVTVKKLEEKYRIPIFIPLIIIIILSSLFLIFNYDVEYDLEAIKMLESLNEKPITANAFYPQSIFLEPTNLPKTIEELKFFAMNREKGESLRTSIPATVKTVPIDGFNSIEELINIGKENGLTHLIISKDNSNNLFSEIYLNENKFSYLKKINDESEYSKYKIKVFEINYEVYFETKENSLKKLSKEK